MIPWVLPVGWKTILWGLVIAAGVKRYVDPKVGWFIPTKMASDHQRIYRWTLQSEVIEKQILWDRSNFILVLQASRMYEDKSSISGGCWPNLHFQKKSPSSAGPRVYRDVWKLQCHWSGGGTKKFRELPWQYPKCLESFGGVMLLSKFAPGFFWQTPMNMCICSLNDSCLAFQNLVWMFLRGGPIEILNRWMICLSEGIFAPIIPPFWRVRLLLHYSSAKNLGCDDVMMWCESIEIPNFSLGKVGFKKRPRMIQNKKKS